MSLRLGWDLEATVPSKNDHIWLLKDLASFFETFFHFRLGHVILLTCFKHVLKTHFFSSTFYGVQLCEGRQYEISFPPNALFFWLGVCIVFVMLFIMCSGNKLWLDFFFCTTFSRRFFSLHFSPLIREMVQLRRMMDGWRGSSKTKGPMLGSVSASTAVMLIEFMLDLSQIWASLGTRDGALSFTSIRNICRVPVLLAGGEPEKWKKKEWVRKSSE